ncbi:hypothetical protein F511_04750 [Dorcoceras hygrometricum]|uniref:YTH domain-containing family protein n=1 Tax=Dorcoceras hygrometricum TaxID=472368 RepID=A0A2Z7B210_9LAMI|nr:hypothetical protein F511_04750 [Dorcoceras hygrometricum]
MNQSGVKFCDPLLLSAIEGADLLQNLTLDSQAKTFEVSDATKKPSVDSANGGNRIQSDRSISPLIPDFMDPTMCYLPNGYPSPAYYYSGYDGSANDWDEYNRFVNPDGLEISAGVYGDNGSLLYHPGYGYAPYGPYSPAVSPVPTVGHDGQTYGAQHYQYPTPYFQSLAPTGGQFPTMATTQKGDMATAAVADQASLPIDSTNSKSNGISNGVTTKGNNVSAQARGTYNSSFNVNGSYGRSGLTGGIPNSGYQDPRFGFDGIQGLHHPRPMSAMNTSNGYMNRLFPNKFYGQYGKAYKSGLGYGSNGYDSRTNGRDWTTLDSKYRPRGRGNGLYGYGNESLDGLNELNRGPRAKISKNQKGFAPAVLAVKGQNIALTGAADYEKEKSSVCPDREQYNRPDFPDTYADARFFIIKSYSEDDVHKSIKYNVWTSTPNGNKKLDSAYQDSQTKPGGCPVFLFFSVNTSGQFVGVGEMVGPVDFNKTVEYWQQDKWIGCFPVKWHIVKDVPNSLLKHIILEDNENKPVTNSRDTQEVRLDLGLQMLKIFKDHAIKQCILDDFEFYEDRQKRIQEKKAKQQQFQKQAQVWEGKPSEEKSKESINGDPKLLKSSEVASDSNKQSTTVAQTIGDFITTKNDASPKSGDNFVSAAVPEKIVANGLATGC